MQVNGPEGEALDWDAVDWRTHEDNVRRLRGRIFKAAQEGDWPKARNLQRMMLRSWSNTLVSVRQVTQRNAGRKTAGVDGQVALTSQARAELAVQTHRTITTWKPLAVRRVYIPKARDKTKLRPLGIPVIADRAHQARHRNALEPEWEARFEPRSYGFRPGRCCQDAIAVAYTTACGADATRRWVLDADLEKAFDKIDHCHLLTAIGAYPGRDMVRGWLKAGVFEPGRGFAPTGEGTPQGGVISPLLLNIALHGMEQAAGVRYGRSNPTWVHRESPTLVRYADDLTVFCHTREQAEQVKSRLAAWLAPRGLSFNEDKTRIAHLDQEGVDFLGFDIRRHRGKLLIKPGKAAIKRVKKRLAAEMRALRGANAAAVLTTVNPIIRGWANYYRGVVSSRVYSSLDNYMWRLTYKWACSVHPNKPKRWIVRRYFGRHNKNRSDRWVFGNPNSSAYMVKFSWTEITRHVLVKGGASPDDPAQARYWAARRRKNRPPLTPGTLAMLRGQRGRCPLCGDLLLYAGREPHSPEEWEQWDRTTRKAITKQAIAINGRGGVPGTTTRLVHSYCQRRATGAKEPALLYA